jgi:hypothetical protein
MQRMVVLQAAKLALAGVASGTVAALAARGNSHSFRKGSTRVEGLSSQGRYNALPGRG